MRLARLIRNRVIGLARSARTRVAGIRRRRPRVLAFVAVRRRLELLLSAMFDPSIAEGLMARTPTAEPNDRSIVLPAWMPDKGEAAERYRLLAIEQGARIDRGTRLSVPADPLERDLYTIIEGRSIDAHLVERGPGLSSAIMRLRHEELHRRSPLYVDVSVRPIESLLRDVLGSDPSSDVESIPRTATPQESASVARKLAQRIRHETKPRTVYGAMQAIQIWDYEGAGMRAPDAESLPRTDTPIGSAKDASHRTESDTNEAKPDEAAEGGRPDEETPESEDKTPMQGGAGTSEDAAGTPAPEDEVSFPKDDMPAMPAAPAPGGIQYPEWIDRLKRIEPRHTTVFDVAAAEGDAAWAREALRAHARLIGQLRDRFSRLRARRLRLRAQRSGEEIDLDACVKAVIDLQLKQVPSDRLYQTTRSSRHPLAITILVDVSGSTQSLLPDGQSVLDVERLSVLLASEALSSLGDPYSIMAFAGNSRHSVRVSTLKTFGERDLGLMHRRISTLESGDNTRLGAAVRHATARLVQQSAHRHVLLILSDGKPHDVDWYWSDAAIEDSRIALLVARAAGVHSFCITVDSKEADYLPHLFGEGRYWVLANPAELPKALIRLIDTILTA
jgi:nitric oxide reductase NorD protein